MTPPVGQSRASRYHRLPSYYGGREPGHAGAYAVWEDTGKGKTNRSRTADHPVRRVPDS